MKDKRYVKFIGTTRESELTFNERILYSLCAHAAKWDDGITSKGIHDATNWHRSETIPKLRERLTDLALCEVRNNKLFACEPGANTRGWFRHWRKEGAAWHERFQYFRVFLPKPELSLRAAALFSFLYSLVGGAGVTEGVSDRYFASVLSVDEATVTRILQELTDWCMVWRHQVNSKRYIMAVAELKQTHLDLFQDAKKVRQEKVIVEIPPVEMPEWAAKMFDRTSFFARKQRERLDGSNVY